MKVKDLLDKLSSLSPEAVVRIPYPDNGLGFWPITGMTYNDEEVDLYADDP